MTIHLRQICLVARDLAPAIADLRAVLDLPVAHVDPAVGKYGLENTLLTVGTQFLEVVAPIRDNTAAGRYLDRRGGDGGYMVICQASSRAVQDELRENAADADVREAYFSDRGDWNILQLHPGDLKAAFLEVDWDAQDDPTGNWMPAGGLDWRDGGGTGASIAAVDLQSDDPSALAELWGAVLGLPVDGPRASPEIALADARLRFVEDRDGRGPGLSALDLRMRDPAAARARAAAAGLRSGSGAVICGTRFRFLD
ncbi:VOC family protein [Pseudooceanicola sp. LIPI14-2-Ac024]|uniref:VOC family protein n=1 Tax=Pseudooceanicola sp. LIPI14-2-Ac024 TaxID=3344875 RepID=UPI0035D11F39